MEETDTKSMTDSDLYTMTIPPVILSLAETDLYKFSMGQAIYHQFSNYNTTWAFKCRNKNVKFTKEMVNEIRAQIKHYCSLRFTDDELEYLHSIGGKNGNPGWIHSNYIDFLRRWQPRFEDFTIEYDESANSNIRIRAQGTWLNTSMYEIPVLAIVNEVYFRMTYNYDELITQFKRKLDEKVADLQSGKYELGPFSEFGLRRRLSAEAQELAVKAFTYNKCEGSTFVGTSNVYLAKKYGVTPVGTMAHEFIQCVGQGNPKHNPAYSNWYSMEAWVKEYGVLNGTYLTDCITDELCRMDMNLTYATLFSGVRNDSGDPYEWAENWIKKYEGLGIDPKTKTLLFSSSLDFEKATELRRAFKDRTKTAFGIGTYCSNDTDVEPLNIVMKVVKCNGTDVAKISDDSGKGMCENPEYVDYLTKSINWRKEHNEVR